MSTAEDNIVENNEPAAEEPAPAAAEEPTPAAAEEPAPAEPAEEPAEEPADDEPHVDDEPFVTTVPDMHEDDDSDDAVLDDADLIDAYDAIYDDIVAMIGNGGVDEENVTNIIAAVMEAIDALGRSMELSGRDKAKAAKKLTKHILTHLKNEGKMNAELHRKFMTALNISSLVMFTLPILADKGKILLQHTKNALHRACVRCKNKQAVKMEKSRKLRERKHELDMLARGLKVKVVARGDDSDDSDSDSDEDNTCLCKNDQCARCLKL